MISHEKGQNPIRKILEKRDTDLYHRIETLWIRAHELQERQRSKEHHQQGYLHCKAVENNLGKIISDDEKYIRFSPLELFLLSAAACYHDVGKSDDFDEGHATVAMKDICSHPEKYYLNDPEGKVLSIIIGSHDIDEVFNETPEIYPIVSDDVHVKLLSALFRLADVLHTDNSRIPDIVVGDVKKVDDKTRFRKLIQGWSFNDESQIVLKAAPDNTSDINIIAKGVSMMQNQLECVSPILRSEGYPYEIIYSCDYRGIKWNAETENKRNLIEMDFYTENEADIFKGREVESERLLKKVIGSNISLLIGNSGVGKTSLIRAGLFPKISKIGWKCIWTRPVNPNPLDYILNDINANLSVEYESNDIISSIKKFSEQYGTSDIIIAIDQFEDILRSPQQVKDELGKILLRIYGKSFKNVHILLSYRGDYEPEVNSFLDNSGIINPNRFPLLGLDIKGAHDAFRSIFEANNVGISDELIDRIIKELEKESELGKFNPPFIQIVASSLINLTESNGGIITEELYNNEDYSVETIIGEYLINRLNEFGDINSEKRINAEAILKELVRDRAKEQKGKDELLRYLNIPEDELIELLDVLVDNRLIRHLGNNNYEIIHDFLALRVEEMITDEERPLRGARDILRIKAQHYRYMPTPSLLEPNEMVLLYSMKESIAPDINEKELLIFSYLSGNGPIWWWFRNDENIMRTIIKKALNSRFLKIKRGALTTFEKLAIHDDIPTLMEMIDEGDSDIREVGLAAFEKLATYDDFHLIKKMLRDYDRDVMRVACIAFEKIVKLDDLPLLREMIQDSNSEIRRVAVASIGKLGSHEDLPIIKDMLQNYDKEVRKAAVTAFEKVVTNEDYPIIEKMFWHYDRVLRQAAAAAFIKFATHEDLPTIKEMLRDYDREVRRSAALALKKIATHEDLTIIISTVLNDDKKVREITTEAFIKLVKHEDILTLKKMLLNNKKVSEILAENFIKRFNDDIIVSEIEEDQFMRFLNWREISKSKSMFLNGDINARKFEADQFMRFQTYREISKLKSMFLNDDINAREFAADQFARLLVNNYTIGLKKPKLFMQEFHLNQLKSLILWSNDIVPKEKFDTLEDTMINYDEFPMMIEMLNNKKSTVRLNVSNFIIKFGNEDILQEIIAKYTKGDIINEETLKCIIALDEKLYSTFEKF